jgi:DNA invertase Pin-like site-specific DNA recombinase
MVLREPRKASARLRELLKKHETIAEVSRRLRVDRRTVERWIRRLGELRLDPRLDPPKD